MMPMTAAAAQNPIERAVRPVGLYRVSEAALMLGLCVETVHRRIRRGQIRAWGSPQKVSLDDLMPLYIPHARKK